MTEKGLEDISSDEERTDLDQQQHLSESQINITPETDYDYVLLSRKKDRETRLKEIYSQYPKIVQQFITLLSKLGIYDHSIATYFQRKAIKKHYEYVQGLVASLESKVTIAEENVTSSEIKAAEFTKKMAESQERYAAAESLDSKLREKIERLKSSPEYNVDEYAKLRNDLLVCAREKRKNRLNARKFEFKALSYHNAKNYYLKRRNIIANDLEIAYNLQLDLELKLQDSMSSYDIEKEQDELLASLSQVKALAERIKMLDSTKYETEKLNVLYPIEANIANSLINSEDEEGLKDDAISKMLKETYL